MTPAPDPEATLRETLEKFFQGVPPMSWPLFLDSLVAALAPLLTPMAWQPVKLSIEVQNNYIATIHEKLAQAERDRDAARVMVALLLTRKDCPACDFGKLRNPENVGHWPECVYGQAERWLATGR